MNDIGVIALGMFAAVAPLGAIRPLSPYRSLEDSRGWATLSAIACLAAFASFTGVAIVADSFLDFIHVSAESFQFAAAAVMAPFAVRLLLAGDSMPPPDPGSGHFEPWLFPLAIPLLAGPAALTAALSYSARFGEGAAISGATVALVASFGIVAASSGLRQAIGRAGIDAAARLSGALLLILAVELAIDGVRST